VIHPLARALYESRSALLELVGVRLCLSFARVFVLGSKSKRSLLIVLLFLSLVDDDERDLSNYMLTFLYLLNFLTCNVSKSKKVMSDGLEEQRRRRSHG